MPPSINPETEFTYVVFPDTQYYSEQDNGIFEAMGQWVADHKDDYNIKMLLHEGDLVQNNHGELSEWDIAEDAIGRVDNAGIPTLLALGNHDGPIRNPTIFRSRFPADRYDRIASYDGIADTGVYNDTENAYLRLESHGEAFLFISIEFGARDEVLDWAVSKFREHDDAHGVLVTHSFLFNDGTQVEAGDRHAPTDYVNNGNNGSEMWDGWLSDVETLRAIHSGHHISGEYVARRSDYTAEGNAVSQQFFDYQTLSNGGDGWIRLVTIDSETMTARVNQHSTVKGEWADDSGESFVFPFESWISRSSQVGELRQVTFGR